MANHIKQVLYNDRAKVVIEERTALLETLTADCHISNMELLAFKEPNEFLEGIVIRLKKKIAFIPGGDLLSIEEIKVPETWWDHFKESHFDFLLRWFPVKYSVIQDPTEFQAREYLLDLEVPEGLGESVVRWQELVLNDE